MVVMESAMINYKFNPEMPLIARKDFVYQGENIERGVIFKHDNFGVETRVIYQLIEAGNVKPLELVGKDEFLSWDYRQLQLICRDLGVRGHGSLGDLQKRLWKRIIKY